MFLIHIPCYFQILNLGVRNMYIDTNSGSNSVKSDSIILYAPYYAAFRDSSDFRRDVGTTTDVALMLWPPQAILSNDGGGNGDEK